MDSDLLIKEAVKEGLGLTVSSVSRLGKGASGSVYRVICGKENRAIAVKISEHPLLMRQEYEMLSFLREKTESKIPEAYFFGERDGKGIIVMEFIDGVSGADRSLRFRAGKKHLAESIVNNLITLQRTKGEKFGPYDNPVYDTWQAYYREFAEEIYTFSLSKNEKGALDSRVMRAVEASFKCFDRIFCEEIYPPTLIHGDYWMPNFIIDKRKMELLSVVDPFNVMWADPEYELFAMTVGYGEKLHLYELYKSKVRVSVHCDMKLELYALYSELLWYKRLGTIEHSYLLLRAKRLMKEMKKAGIAVGESLD
ncbi:MAG: hypothetical protein E7543_05330 [Ruminococcaceae bacterium]|nr:hypothetical protein [Oscillospiraceae bacterium]